MKRNQIQAGIAEMDICPGHKAQALAMQNENNQLMLISLDLSGFPREYSGNIVSTICQQSNFSPSEIMVICSGTCSGPATSYQYGSKKPDVYLLQELLIKLPEMAWQSIAKLQPASVGIYRANLANIAHNSRFCTRNFKVVNEWIGLPPNEVLAPEGPIDPDLDVMVIRSQADDLLALTWTYSARDRFPASLAQTVQDELDCRLGCHVPTFYLPGCGGNIDYNYSLEKTSSLLADSIMAAQYMACCDPAATLGAEKREVILPVRDYSIFNDRAEIALKMPEAVDIFAKELADLQQTAPLAMMTDIQVLRIGYYALVGFPGDTFTEFSLDLKKRSPFRLTGVTGLCGDALGYIIPKKSFDNGGFEAWPARWANTAKGCGEFMADELALLLQKLFE